MAEQKEHFLGAYFDRDGVLRLARLLVILSWVVVGIYAVDLALGLGVMFLQYVRGFMPGMGFTDALQNLVYIFERPVHGIVYFAVLQALARGLQIFMDVEDNTRRAART